MTEVREKIDLEWLITSRSESQKISLELYNTLNKNPAAKKSSEARTLVAVAFSLWRSVFLGGDRKGNLDARAQHAEDFLLRMLRDNAIGYPQERESKEWTFNYYLDNAKYRLEELGQDWPEILNDGRLYPKGRLSGRKRWTYVHSAFARAVRVFIEMAETDQFSN